VIGRNVECSAGRAVTRSPRHHFFGYYDKCPWDSTGRYMLALETDFMERPPRPVDTAVVGLIDLARITNGSSLRTPTRGTGSRAACFSGKARMEID